MDRAQVGLLRDLLSATGWVERTSDFAGSLRRSTTRYGDGGLLLVGTPDEEPWHLAAHLDDEARFHGVTEISPTLVRYAPPPDAPPHLSVGLERLEAARRGETLFVVAPEHAPERLLDRIADARRIGATILSIDDGDDDLGDLAHDRLVVTRHELATPESSVDVMTDPFNALARDLPVTGAVDFDTVQHLVSVAAAEDTQSGSLRERLSKFLDRVSGPVPRR